MYSVGFGKLDNPNIKAHGDTVIINDGYGRYHIITACSHQKQ